MDRINNNIIYYALTFILYPLFLYLLITIIYMLMFIFFFADPILCQNINIEANTSLQNVESFPSSSGFELVEEKLKDLKDNIDRCKILGEKAYKDYIKWMKLWEEAITRPERHKLIEDYLRTKTEESVKDYANYWNKISLMREMIEETTKIIK
jgi:hypothetical protein